MRTSRCTAQCPYCGRLVETMNGPGGRVVMSGHHVTKEWSKADQLCQGSGEEVGRG